MKRLFWFLAIGLLLTPATARAQTEEVIYYHTDAIGSVRAVTDAAGAVVARYDFAPFGEEWPQTPPTTNPDVRQYAGKERDAETGLDYFGARYFRSASGRFTTVDPVIDVKHALIDPQRWNRYEYAANNPFKYVDPDGRAIDVALDVIFIGTDIAAIAKEGLTTGNSISLAGDVVGAFVPFATGVGAAARRGYDLAMAGRSLEQAAQWAAGLGRNTERILEGVARGAGFRVPDLLSHAGQFVGEVKNVAQLSLTKQMSDLIQYSSATKKELGLFVNEGTRLSKPLLEELQSAHARIYRFVDQRWKDVSEELYKTLR